MVELDRLDSSASFASFSKAAWHVLEPSTPLQWGWALDAMAEHLEAVHLGQILRLLINVPPGAMKSLMSGVLFPAWEWGPKDKPGLRFVGASHRADYAIRDSRKMRDLVDSPWYQERWGDRVRLKLKGDELFSNAANGERRAVPFTGLTGARGDRLIIDDPISTEQAESAAELKKAARITRESASNRVNDPATSAIIVIMQRLHPRDPAGVILADIGGYEHLMLPMEFEPDRRCTTSIGFTDPRTKEGELLFPERFSRETVDRDKRAMGSYAWAGQAQQRPAPRGGGLVKVENMGTVDAWPAGARLARAWDFAGTEQTADNDPDFTAGVLIAEHAGSYTILHIRADKKDPTGVERMVRQTAEKDGPSVTIIIKQEPGASGKANAQHYQKTVLRGFTVEIVPDMGSKVSRGDPLVSAIGAGNVALLRETAGDPWHEGWFEECRAWPGKGHDDRFDAAASAQHWLAARARSSGVWAR